MKTTDKIKEEAGKIISEQGLDHLSMRKLAEAVGIKGASIYKHFSSKNHLLSILKMDALGLLYEAMEKTLVKNESSEQRILSLGIAYIQFAHSHKEKFRLLFFESLSQRSSLEEEVGSSNPYGLLNDEFLKLLENTALTKPEVEAKTYGFWAMVHGMASLGIGHLEQFIMDVEAVNEMAMGHYLTGLQS